MQHMLVVVNIAAFGAGLVAATLAFQTYRQHRLPHLRHFFHYLLLLNVIVGMYLTAAYLVANIETVQAGGRRNWAESVFQVFGTVVMAAWLYKLIAVMRGIRDREMPSRFRLFWAIGTAVMAGSLLSLQALTRNLPAQDILHRLEYTLYLSMMVAAMAVSLHTLLACRSLEDEGRRKAVKLFSGIHLSLFVLAPCAAALPAPLSWYAVSCGLILSSLVPTLYLRMSVLGRRAQVLVHTDSAEVMRQFADRFGISSREGEIVKLVLAGKTNAEIGDILFISPNTVRNHIYNIYQKAGVRNRIELTNLILEQR